MDDTAPKTEDWVQELIRNYQDTLTCGLYEAIYRLEQPCVETLMQAQAQTCAGAFLKLSALPIPMEIDAFFETMRIAGPSQIDIQRDGEVIRWTEQHHGECVCPFIKRGVVRLDPKLCVCGAHWVKVLFETVTQTRVDIEMLETVATGAQNCCFVIRVKDSKD